MSTIRALQRAACFRLLSEVGATNAWTPAVDALFPLDEQSRPTRQDVMADFARIVAARSTCQRMQVGVVLTDNMMTQVHAIGYNGSGRGMTNGCVSHKPGQCGCVHAEANALVHAQTHEPLVMVTTLSPCRMCAQLILNSRVHTVVYLDEYRSDAGLELLRRHGIIVARYVPGE